MRHLIILALLLVSSGMLNAQMEIEGKTLYGNEWIDYDKEYIKIIVLQDGIYKLDYQSLLDSGFPANFSGSQLKLENNGGEQAVFTSSEATWTEGDYLLFYGEHNDGEIDKFNYKDWTSEQLNPKYSMYSEERVYFLSLTSISESNVLSYCSFKRCFIC